MYDDGMDVYRGEVDYDEHAYWRAERAAESVGYRADVIAPTETAAEYAQRVGANDVPTWARCKVQGCKDAARRVPRPRYMTRLERVLAWILCIPLTDRKDD